MNFPSSPTFTARVFASDDAELSQALVQAYNDWHIDEWCGTHPARFIPMAVPVIWDAEKTAAEIRRVAAKGCHSLSFTENPAALGYPKSPPRRVLGSGLEGLLRHRHRALYRPWLLRQDGHPRHRLAPHAHEHHPAAN